MLFIHLPYLLVILAVCFFIGALNPATMLARLRGVDLTASGSGNPGATNAGRVMGRKWGVVVGALDVLKGWLPTFVVLQLEGQWFAMCAGLAVVLGHVYSPYLGGRGGKGVATSLGAILAVVPVVAPVVVVAFLMAVPWVKRFGDASVIATVVLVVIGFAVGVGWVVLPSHSHLVGWWLVVLGGIVLWRHQGNIVLMARRTS